MSMQKQNKENKMENVNVNAVVKDIMDFDKQSELYHYKEAVAREVEKVKINYNFETREHTLKDGEIGDVSQKLVIEIDFSNTIIQPHTDFESGFIHVIVEQLASEVSGLYENQD